MATKREPVNYGVPTEDYVAGLEAELAAAGSDEQKAAINAELKSAKAHL